MKFPSKLVATTTTAVFALLSAIATIAASPSSVSGTRLLAVVGSGDRTRYSQYLLSLEARGFDLTTSTPSTASAAEALFGFGERLFDHVLLLDDSETDITSGSSALSPDSLMEFITKGGNVLIATSTTASDFVRDFSFEFSADFDDQGTAVLDSFNSKKDDPYTVTAFVNKATLVNNAAVFPEKGKKDHFKNPVLFRGIAHRLTGKNELITPLLNGAASAYSFIHGDTDRAVADQSPFVGADVVLVSALQALNNARVVFCGSADMFSNEFIDATGIKAANGETFEKTGNLDFITEVTKWVFQEKAVLRTKNVKHHRVDETGQHGIYRIKDNMTYELDIQEWYNGKWNPFYATDAQFQAVMLDPYAITTMTPDAATGHYTAHFTLPDQHGVFTFLFQYERHGYTWLKNAETVQVRPFRHDQYPRFIPAAFPYYANAFAMMGGFVALSAVWLFHVDSERKGVVDGKKKQ